MVLIKSVLEAIPVYWVSSTFIPKGILEKVRKMSFKFLWAGEQKKNHFPWVSCKRIAIPKELGMRDKEHTSFC